MRHALQPFAGKRMRFRGIFVCYGERRTWRGVDKRTLLLREIVELRSNTMMAYHLWFALTKGFKKVGALQVGDRLEFNARVWTYPEQYGGYDVLARRYKLSHPTKIVLVQYKGDSDPRNH